MASRAAVLPLVARSAHLQPGGAHPDPSAGRDRDGRALAWYLPTGATATERFHLVLARAPIEPAHPLPHHFRPLQRAIAGSRPVHLRTGPATQAALAAAGKPAATVGGVIHLRRPPDRSPASVELVAHELVHAACPSRLARFFGDERRGAEEHLAEHTGHLARALVAPEVASPPPNPAADRLAWGTRGMPVGHLGGAVKALAGEIAAQIPPPTAGGAAVRRRASSGAGSRPSLVERTADLFRQAASGSVGGVSARGPAGREGTAAGVASGLETLSSVGSGAEAPFPNPDNPTVVRRSAWRGVQRFTSAPATATPSRQSTIGGVDADLFDALLEALEQRVVDELERRGLRHHPGVF